MSEPVRYITDELGNRVGMVLDFERYPHLASPLALDTDCLLGLSLDELNALAHCRLASDDQTRLNDLLQRNGDPQLLGGLTEDEVGEMDRLLAEGDHLMVLKARARYTLKRLSELFPDDVLKVS
ncbi:MAG: hypothetical protein MUF49_02510 [Oculatellaceae cyanobacterium Prado106]|jgi:hypothetical protein|nr:hypothetical protein [Oculatellaceae cyanobacterium Prado106]